MFRKRDPQVKLQPKPPRLIDEIKAEYADLLGKAAQTGYQVYVYKKELARLNDRLEQVNNEGAQRQQLDKESAKTAAEASNEQTQQ